MCWGGRCKCQVLSVWQALWCWYKQCLRSFTGDMNERVGISSALQYLPSNSGLSYDLGCNIVFNAEY